MLRIGELAERTGLTTSKIRFFEKEGIFNQNQRQANGYRKYPNEAVDILILISQAQEVGFSLNEIKELFPVNNADYRELPQFVLRAAVVKKMESLRKIQQKLEENQSKLAQILEELDRPEQDSDCILRANHILGMPE